MPTKNEILAGLINKAAQLSAFTNPLYSDSALDLIRSELEDTRLLEDLNKINSAPPFYNPFGVEFLIGDTTELLKSCLQKRTELKNLEVVLLNDCIGKLMAARRKEFENDIDELNKNYPGSSGILSKQTKLKTNLDSVEADEASSVQVKNYETSVRDIKEKLDTEAAHYEKVLEEFSADKNSGLNYLTRYIELKEIYWEDYRELFRKLKSLEVGFKTVYDMNVPLPEIGSDNLLNKYYIWLKNGMLALNKILETEQEFTMAISIKGGRPGYGSGEDLFPVVVRPNNGIHFLLNASGNLKFSLGYASSSDFFYQKKLRLRSIGASIRLHDEIENNTKTTDYWSVSLRPPAQTDSAGNKITLPIQHILCTNSKETTFDHQHKSSAIFNINPIPEWWELFLSKRGTNRNDYGRAVTYGNDYIVEDVILFFKVAYSK